MLTQNAHNLERKKKLRWFLTVSTMPLLGVVTAFGLVPSNNLGLNTEKIVIEQLALPKTTSNEIANTTFWHTERAQPGYTVDELLQRLNVKDAAASNYLRNSADARAFRKLSADKEVQAETDTTGALISLSYLGEQGVKVVIKKQGDTFTAKTVAAQLEKRLFVRTGEIKTSLYAATDAAGMPEAAADQLTQIFSGDVDFHHDLKPGDRFTAVYEMTYSNGALVKAGQIQAAEFINQGHAYRAVRFQTDASHSDYYTPEGKSLKKAFLRSPIAFSRVSSGFTISRFHPVLNTWRAHKGVDFAAPTGTPVKATANGLVSFVGKQNGYGNVIMLKHQSNVSTVYGHLSRFANGLHNGQRITQGDVIGYVGMTGLASGPHLHYEYKIDGQQRDPLRVALPNTLPVSGENKVAFKKMSDKFIASLVQLRNTNLAKLD
jgi:murein DD-endopeptidase MepM/ murein hydrolase activator NlpD